MALPIKHNISMYRGDPYEELITITVNDAPVDFTEGGDVEVVATAHWRAKEDNAEFIPFTVDVSAANEGKFLISMTPEQTALVAVSGGWDLDINGDTWIRGTVKNTKDWTHS